MITEKEKSKIIKELGQQFVNEMHGLSSEDLNSKIVNAAQSIKTAAEELEANEKYQQAREAASMLKSGLNAVKKRQNAIAQYALHLLEEKGQ